jgi:hypothetical protein
VLAREQTSPKECLQLADALGHYVGDVRIVGRDLQRRVHQKATKTVFQRPFDDLGEECFDRLAWRECLFDASDAGTHVGIEIAVQASREERPFIAESIVDARRAKPHGVSQIAH